MRLRGSSLTRTDVERMLTIGMLAFATMMLFAHPSFAEDGGAGFRPNDALWSNAQNKATDFFYQFRTVVLIIAGIAIIATLITAVSGRFPIQKALVISIAIVGIALASSIVTYFASNSSATSVPANPIPREIDTGTQ